MRSPPTSSQTDAPVVLELTRATTVCVPGAHVRSASTLESGVPPVGDIVSSALEPGSAIHARSSLGGAPVMSMLIEARRQREALKNACTIARSERGGNGVGGVGVLELELCERGEAQVREDVRKCGAGLLRHEGEDEHDQWGELDPRGVESLRGVGYTSCADR